MYNSVFAGLARRAQIVDFSVALDESHARYTDGWGQAFAFSTHENGLVISAHQVDPATGETMANWTLRALPAQLRRFVREMNQHGSQFTDGKALTEEMFAALKKFCA